MKVKIKQNDNKGNKSTLYLAPYENGKYGYYKIDLHIYTKPTTVAEKEHNKETLRKAEILRIRLESQLQEESTGIISTKSRKLNFIEFFESILIEKCKNTSISNKELYTSTLKHFKKFRKGKDISIRDIDENMCQRFKEYLSNIKGDRTKRKLKENSKSVYFDKFRSVLIEAVKRKMISTSPAKYVKGIKLEKTQRNYLTEQELQLLKNTPCEREILKKAFLFSCLTGLRHSDIIQLRWKHITYSHTEDSWKINFRQKKTGLVQYHPISPLAKSIIGDSSESEHLIFKDLKYNTWFNDILKKWVNDAGIDKHITYHCSRHTYATLLLTKDVSIYVVKELMGHENLATTEIYAKMIDKNKNVAAYTLNGIF